MRGGDRNSGRKLEVTVKAGVVVLVLMVMRGRDRKSGRSLDRRGEGVEPW